MKQLLFTLTIISGQIFTMQQAPKVKDLWPSNHSDYWIYEKVLGENFCKDQVTAEIEQAYSSEERIKLEQCFFYENKLYMVFKDSKENIVQKFNEKLWFEADKLRRPLAGRRPA